jgi:hypothetical protein
MKKSRREVEQVDLGQEEPAKECECLKVKILCL